MPCHAIPYHAQWMFYLDLDRSYPMPMHNDQFCACVAHVLPGLGPEFPNANVGQVAVISHACDGAIDVLPDVDWSFQLSMHNDHSHACAVDVIPGLGPELSNAK